ncbi:hypothetical protein P3W45_001782 [Vairimorpha bombi]
MSKEIESKFKTKMIACKEYRYSSDGKSKKGFKIFTDEKLNYISSVDHTHEPSLRSIIRKKSSMKSGMMLELPTNYKRYYCESYKITPTGDLFVLHDLGFNDLRGIVLMGTLSLFYLKATFG